MEKKRDEKLNLIRKIYIYMTSQKKKQQHKMASSQGNSNKKKKSKLTDNSAFFAHTLAYVYVYICASFFFFSTMIKVRNYKLQTRERCFALKRT